MNTRSWSVRQIRPLILCGLAALVITGCERPPMDSVQLGYRGLGEQLVVNPRLLAEKVAETVVPAPQPPAAPVPIKAIASYPQLQVLGDLSLTEFNRTMAAITQWVAPKEQGCAYCHNLANMTSDEKYTKVVARSMLRMTQETNYAWKAHVGDTGVTCWTCHRGNAVPRYVFTSDPGPGHPERMVATRQNIASPAVAYSSLPYDPLTVFLDGPDVPISVLSTTALPTGNNTGVKHAEWTYGLMMHISDSLGVNCTYCHNSRSFFSWEKPARVKAWYAIRNVRRLNQGYIWPLTDILPASRKGPQGDPKRIACETCHQGAYKPLFGVPMLKDYPALAAPSGAGAAQPEIAPPPPPFTPSAHGTGAEPAPVQEAGVRDPMLTGARAQSPVL